MRISIMMKYMLKSMLFAGLFFHCLIGANYDYAEFIEFTRNEVFIPKRLGNIKLYKDDYGFHIFKNSETYDIQNCFCDPWLREMSYEQLVNFLGRDKPKIIMLTPDEFDQFNQNEFIEITEDEIDNRIIQLFNSGYISVNQMDNGEYILHAKIRLMGGIGDEAIAAGAGAGALGVAGAVGGTMGVVGALTPVVGPLVPGMVLTTGATLTAGPTGAIIVTQAASGAVFSGAAMGAATAVAAAAVPVLITVGTLYVAYKVVKFASRPTDIPTPPTENPPAAGMDAARQEAPARKVRIVKAL